jgi:hypothetical protein
VKHARTISSPQAPTATPPALTRFLLRPQLLTRLSAPCGQGSRDSSRHGCNDQARTSATCRGELGDSAHSFICVSLGQRRGTVPVVKHAYHQP